MFAPDAVQSVVVTEKNFVGSNPEKINVGTALRQAGVRITLKGMLKGIASIPILTFTYAVGFYVKVIDQTTQSIITINGLTTAETDGKSFKVLYIEKLCVPTSD